MRSYHALLNVSSRTPRTRSSVHIHPRKHPSLLPRPPSPHLEASFADPAVPALLFDDPTIRILKTTSTHSRSGKRLARFLLFRQQESKTLLPPPTPVNGFAARMLTYAQILTTPTADTNGTSILLHFDNQRYIFGNIGEGTQRALVQRKVGLGKVEDVFISGLINWRNAGGLLGLVLTLADSLASSRESLEATQKSKTKRGPNVQVPPSRLNIHGGKNLTHLLATSRRFIFRKGMPLRPHEIRDDPRSSSDPSTEPDWQDKNIQVWHMPITSTPKSTMCPQKRSHEEFAEKPTQNTLQNSEDGRRLVETVVTQMFDSNWSMDALVETKLHQVQLPAKLFVRDAKGHIKVYDGPLPGGEQTVPNINVLVREPWPGATVTSLPRTEPSSQSMCYIVKTHARRGKFNPQAAEKLGVARQNFKVLARGESVEGRDGTVVTPDMVLGETVVGIGFALVDLPDICYVEALVNRSEWSNDQLMQGVHVIFWQLGPNVISDSRIQDFMQKMSTVRHIVSSVDNCPNMISLESAATLAYKLQCIDPNRFPLPVFSNELSLSNTPVVKSISPTYESARTGKTIQLAPNYLHLDDQIVPFPDIEKLARGSLTPQVLDMAREARTKVSDPDFLAKVEKVESDIPNRDAEVITLGTGSALPSKYRNVSATLVRVPGYGNYLFDSGENTLGQMRRLFGEELPAILKDLKGIWISHLHADHHLGTAAVIKAWHEETGPTLPHAKLLVASHIHMMEWLREYADVEDYGYNRLRTVSFDQSNPKSRICKTQLLSGEDTEMFGLSKIDACYVTHCFGALATVFTFPTGFKIAYSGDCRPSDAFVKIGQGATLLIHESTFEDELQGDAMAKKHSTMSEAIDVGRRMGARRLMLTHFSQRYQKIPIFEEDFEIRPDDKAKRDEVILVAFDYMRVRIGDFRKAQAFLPAVQKLFEDVEQGIPGTAASTGPD